MAEDRSFSGSERRRSPRFAVRCRCWVEQDAMTLFGTVTNLSETGLFLRTLPIVGEGRDVEVRLSLGGGVVVGKGAIRWRAEPSQRGDAGGPPGMGIELTDVTAGQELLAGYLGRRSLVPEP